MNQRTPYRSFVSYMDRSRDYYAAQGYAQPYAWAHHRDVPFCPLPKPLSACRVGLVTTASLEQTAEDLAGSTQEKRWYAAPSDPAPERLFTDDLFWDKEATHTEDLDSFLPLHRLSELADAGRIGSPSPRFYGVPTEYSQGRTSNQAAPRILEWCREDGVDAVLLSAL